jgi:hypothetical protein
MKLFLCGLALGACALSIQAATLLPGGSDTSPDVNFTATFDPSVPTINLATPNGNDTLLVLDDLNNPVGNVIVTDTGTPGQFILALDSGTLTQSVVFSFNPATASFDGSGNLIMPATGTPGTTITDASLALLVGNSTFAFAPISSEPPNGPFVYDFIGAALPVTSTPEPAVAFTVGIGLLAMSAMRLRKS